MNHRAQLSSIFTAAEGFCALREPQGIRIATQPETVVGCRERSLTLLLQFEQQRQVRATAAALRTLLDLGSANGTAHRSHVFQVK
jgi:hypothetical protein